MGRKKIYLVNSGKCIFCDKYNQGNNKFCDEEVVNKRGVITKFHKVCYYKSLLERNGDAK